jgi:hypothetical protein
MLYYVRSLYTMNSYILRKIYKRNICNIHSAQSTMKIRCVVSAVKHVYTWTDATYRRSIRCMQIINLKT